MNSRIILSENIFAQEVDGEMMLMDMQSEEYFGLDTVGASFWQAIKEEKTLKKALEYLLDLYDTEESVLKKDLIEFAEKLKTNGLASIAEE